MKRIKGLLGRRSNSTAGLPDDASDPSPAQAAASRSSSSRKGVTVAAGGQTSARAALPAFAATAHEDEEEAAAAAAAEAAWLADNARMGAMGDLRAPGKGRRRTDGAKPQPRDPEIPDWCMRDIHMPDDDDGHPQPTRSSQSRSHDGADLPRDDRECVICQEHKKARWRALPCAHVFHDDCVKEWLQQNPSCPVCRMAFPTLQAGHAGPGSQAEAWLGSTAVTVSDGRLSVMHQFEQVNLCPMHPPQRDPRGDLLTATTHEQMMDPNALARVVVPRPISNFMDNLPSEERLASGVPKRALQCPEKSPALS